MKLKKYIFIFFVIGLVTTSCEDLLDINTDPLAATTAQADILLPGVIANIASNRVIEIGPGTNFFVQNWSSNGSAGVFLNPERYTISPFTTGNTWSFNYINALSNLTLAIDDAESSEPMRSNIAGQCRVLANVVYFQMTTLFGDIPYSQANSTDFPQPEFDSQEQVFRGIVNALDTAINRINPDSEVGGATSGDFIYNGDMAKWRKLAKSLQLKTLMFLYNKDQSVGAQIQSLIDEGDLILDVADNAVIPFFEDVTNANNRFKLYNQFGGFSPAEGSVDNGSSYIFAGEPMVDMMNSYSNDPRRATYFEEGEEAAAGEYIGNAPGSTAGGDDISPLGVAFLTRSFPDRLITAAEVNLLIADFLASSNNLAGADTYYRAGVAASMDFFDGKVGEISEAAESAFIGSLADLSTLSQADALTEIRQQQYIAYYERGGDAWANWKRTKVPSLDLPEQAVLGDIIRRYPYPPDEIAANPKVPAQAPLDTPMWYEN